MGDRGTIRLTYGRWWWGGGGGRSDDDEGAERGRGRRAETARHAKTTRDETQAYLSLEVVAVEQVVSGAPELDGLAIPFFWRQRAALRRRIAFDALCRQTTQKIIRTSRDMFTIMLA